MLANFKAWVNKPFSADQSAEKWFLFVGLLIVCVVMWSHIMHYITSDLD